MMKTILRTLTLLVFATVLIVPGPARAQPASSDEFPIPNGYFYTQSAPGQNGAGYRVANEAAIPFWDEFLQHGGIAKFGYPLTGRFIWDGHVVQAFQFGVLRWLGGAERSDILGLEVVGHLSQAVRRAEASPRSSGNAAKYPWSGWWWPASNQASGPRMFDPDGPLSKYDRFVSSLGKPNPRTTDWERSEIFFAGLNWAGHCNGWAAAALLEPEPSAPRVVNGVTFTVGDQKGLLSSYHFADSALWGVGGDQDLGPADFHRTLTSWLSTERKGMVFTFRLVGEEVWSYPAYKYESIMGPDALRPNVWRVRTVVWLMDNNVPVNFVGGQAWPSDEGKVFEYALFGEPGSFDGGEWGPEADARFGRPFMLWYPDPTRRNVGRQLASPELDYDNIERILRG